MLSNCFYKKKFFCGFWDEILFDVLFDVIVSICFFLLSLYDVFIKINIKIKKLDLKIVKIDL